MFVISDSRLSMAKACVYLNAISVLIGGFREYGEICVVLNVADIFTDQIYVFLTSFNQNLIALLFIY